MWQNDAAHRYHFWSGMFSLPQQLHQNTGVQQKKTTAVRKRQQLQGHQIGQTCNEILSLVTECEQARPLMTEGIVKRN